VTFVPFPLLQESVDLITRDWRVDMRWTKLAVTLGLLLLGASDAWAGYWSSNGAGCTPGDPAIQADRYFITAGSVNYRPGASGLVTLYCPVNPMAVMVLEEDGIVASAWCPLKYDLRLTYRDSDGAGNAVSIQAQLIRLSKANGDFLGPLPGAQIFTNFSNTTVPTSLSTLAFEHNFDFTAAYYYVRVDMNRAAGTSHVATFYGVTLECTA